MCYPAWCDPHFVFHVSQFRVLPFAVNACSAVGPESQEPSRDRKPANASNSDLLLAIHTTPCLDGGFMTYFIMTGDAADQHGIYSPAQGYASYKPIPGQEIETQVYPWRGLKLAGEYEQHAPAHVYEHPFDVIRQCQGVTGPSVMFVQDTLTGLVVKNSRRNAKLLVHLLDFATIWNGWGGGDHLQVRSIRASVDPDRLPVDKRARRKKDDDCPDLSLAMIGGGPPAPNPQAGPGDC